MDFPEKIPKEDLEMVVKEWELVGIKYRIQFGHLMIYRPVSDGGSLLKLGLWAEGPSYRDEGDHWQLNFPPRGKTLVGSVPKKRTK